jgi:hypothetical protein
MWERELFHTRTHHRPIVVGNQDSAHGCRLGGTPPTWLVERQQSSSGTFSYVLTLGGKDVAPLLSDKQELSLLVDMSDAAILCSQSYTTNVAILPVVHPPSPRHHAPVDWQWTPLGKSLVLDPAAPDQTQADSKQPSVFSKWGGKPWFVQDWGQEEHLAICQDGNFAFLMQLEDTIEESSGLYFLGGSGMLYIYSRIDPDSHLPTLSEFRCFLQI